MVVCPTPVSPPSRPRGLTLLAGLGLSLVLAACGSSDDTLSGTAATGAPIVGGAVDVKCKTGAALSATTSDAGAWSVTLAGQTLPCKVRVRGGTANSQANTTDYHSVATAPGTLNITPLTDLAVAQLAKEAPSAWFGKEEAADFAAIDATKVAAAVTAVVDALGVKDFLGTDNPLTTAFVAKVNATDKIDQALEALKAVNHEDLLAAAVSAASPEALLAAAASFKSAVMAALPVSNDSGGSDPGDLPTGLAGKAFVLAFTNPQANAPFTEGQRYDFVFSSSGMLFYAPKGTSPQRQISTFRVERGEYWWFDTERSLLFAASLKADGSLNEINVGGSSSYPPLPFYGQFKDQSSDPSSSGSGVSVQVGIFGGLSSPPTRIEGVQKPASRTEFCDAAVSGTGDFQVSDALSGLGTYSVTSCNFNNDVGSIEARITVAGVSTVYVVTYTFD
jgi:hypothetical protein